MSDAWIAMIMGLLIFLATIISVEVGISVALIEILLGVVGGNFFGIHSTPWIEARSGPKIAFVVVLWVVLLVFTGRLIWSWVGR